MRCSDAMTELDAAFGRPLDSSELTAHLASCSQCAAIAERDRRLAQIWNATRPKSPAPLVWNAAWDQIQSALEPAPLALVGSWKPSSRLTAWGAVVTGLTAAAAVLFALLGPPRSDPRPNGLPAQADIAGTSSADLPSIDVGIGETILYRVDEARYVVIQTNEPDEFDSFLVFHGLAEVLPDSLAMHLERIAPSGIPH